MLHTITVSMTAFLTALVMPIVLLTPVKPSSETTRLLVIEAPPQSTETQKVPLIRLKSADTIIQLPLEEYLVGVVLSEMPASFSPEALKAQAVAARTFALRQMEHSKHSDFDVCGSSSCCQAWVGTDALKEKLGDSWQQHWQRGQSAVTSTEGEVLTYENKLIDAVYFSCSGGRTEEAIAVWGGDVPYLQSVESPDEESAAKFHSVVTLSQETFQNSLPEVSLKGNPSAWFGTCTKTVGGGVEQLIIGGHPYSGTELRKRFHLNSTQFTVSVTETAIQFEVYGYGHRVGMSQYGANAMAQKGSTYQEILQHYYTGAELEMRY